MRLYLCCHKQYLIRTKCFVSENLPKHEFPEYQDDTSNSSYHDIHNSIPVSLLSRQVSHSFANLLVIIFQKLRLRCLLSSFL